MCDLVPEPGDRVTPEGNTLHIENNDECTVYQIENVYNNEIEAVNLNQPFNGYFTFNRELIELDKYDHTLHKNKSYAESLYHSYCGKIIIGIEELKNAIREIVGSCVESVMMNVALPGPFATVISILRSIRDIIYWHDTITDYTDKIDIEKNEVLSKTSPKAEDEIAYYNVNCRYCNKLIDDARAPTADI